VLGVFVEGVYAIVPTADGPRLAVNDASAPFQRFVHEVGARCDGLVVFGRAAATGAPPDHVMAVPSELCPLPHYSSLRDLLGVARATASSARAMWRGLATVDTVWVFGPNPFGLMLALLTLARGRRLALGVRQDSLAYFRSRLPSRRWLPALAPVWLLDRAFRLLARRAPLTVVGAELARGYGAPRPGVLAMTVSLMRAEDVTAARAPGPLATPVRLLTVGRLEPEKNPFVLLEALRRLEAERPGRYRLEWVGTGRLEDAVRARIAELGLHQVVSLGGHVPFGPDLLARYRSADILVHVALTEGFPQVLVEALASGLPIVATDVGGVRAGMEDGASGVLVPPSDAGALVEAIRALDDDVALRGRLGAAGVARARTMTIDVEAGRVVGFLGLQPGADTR
jgi:glycosyltransferase involved in cell wall biosynthesis